MTKLELDLRRMHHVAESVRDAFRRSDQGAVYESAVSYLVAAESMFRRDDHSSAAHFLKRAEELLCGSNLMAN